MKMIKFKIMWNLAATFSSMTKKLINTWHKVVTVRSISTILFNKEKYFLCKICVKKEAGVSPASMSHL